MDREPDINRGSRSSGLQQGLSFLLGPSETLTDSDARRRSRLLSALLLIMLMVFAFIDTTKSVMDPDYTVVWFGYPFIVAAFALNRRGAFALGSWIILLMFPGVLFAAQILKVSGSGPNTLSYLVLGIMLASLLRPSRETAVYAGLNLVGILLMPLLSRGGIAWEMILTPLAINGIGTALT